MQLGLLRFIRLLPHFAAVSLNHHVMPCTDQPGWRENDRLS